MAVGLQVRQARCSVIRSDALSGETAYAGLPKSAMLRNSASQVGWVAGVASNLSYDTIDFNYGPFVPEFALGAYFGWLVQEPGVYDVLAQCAITAGGQSFRFDVSGNFAFPIVAEVSGLANSPSGIQTIQVASKCVCKTNDVIRATLTQLAPVQNTFASFDWLYVEKIGGQY